MDSQQRALTLHLMLAKFSKWIITGGVTLIVSVMTMMYLTQGVFASQLWFQIRMILIIFILFNGMFVAKSLGKGWTTY